jgi:HTH-type transcriptional regulator/antitoxin HigA
MKAVDTQEQYNEALIKIEDLIIKVGDNHSYDSPEFVMLDRLSDLVADYEDKHYKIELPSLIEVIKLKMYELGINQAELAALVGVPKTRISEYLREKREITLEVARKLHSKLNIDGDIILQ